MRYSSYLVETRRHEYSSRHGGIRGREINGIGETQSHRARTVEERDVTPSGALSRPRAAMATLTRVSLCRSAAWQRDVRSHDAAKRRAESRRSPEKTTRVDG
jgi:hypothetical protein